MKTHPQVAATHEVMTIDKVPTSRGMEGTWPSSHQTVASDVAGKVKMARIVATVLADGVDDALEQHMLTAEVRGAFLVETTATVGRRWLGPLTPPKSSDDDREG